MGDARPLKVLASGTRTGMAAHPGLVAEAEAAASALLATVSFADVADGVFDAVQSLDLDDLDSGPRQAVTSSRGRQHGKSLRTR
jgi:hypothetical protein